mmetsp:Transcript_34842/g.93066  ORF Transcript_34842/g.93066 Transcript_34842/m.93066 type:complete len:478 (-) Transcript_34842:1450-2883(-)
MTPLLGGYIADSYLGRWKAILLFFSIYLVGMTFVAFAAFMPSGPEASMIFFPAAYVVAAGMGGLKPLASTFGADQLDDDEGDEGDEEATGDAGEEGEGEGESEGGLKDSYFSLLYWFQNLGAFAAFTVLVYLCQNVSFQVGFTVAAIGLSLSLLVLVMGSRHYTIKPPEGSPFGVVISVIGQAIVKRVPGQGMLAGARTSFGGRHSDDDVDMVAQLGRLLPVFVILIIYWGINGQMSTTFFNQGCQMNLKVGNDFTVPVAALSLFDTAIIILLVPVFDSWVYPTMRKMGIPTSTLHKMMYGMGIEVAVMAGAAWLESERRAVVDAGHLAGQSVCFEGDGEAEPIIAADMTIFWQVPLFLGMGISEILTSIPAMDFFYSEAPGPMKSVCSALELLTVSLGQWLMAGLIPLVNSGEDKWIPSDLNQVRVVVQRRKQPKYCVLNLTVSRTPLHPALTPPTHRPGRATSRAFSSSSRRSSA